MGRVAQGVKIKVGKMKDNQCNNDHWSIYGGIKFSIDQQQQPDQVGTET
jgi:hypothetical protein